jgi:hypothetical protein
MSSKNFMNVYDQMASGKLTSTGKTLGKGDLNGVDPKGGKDFIKCREAYDQVFTPQEKATPQGPQKVVLSEENLREVRLRRLGAAQCIKERLDQGFTSDDIDEVIATIQDIVKTV